MKRILFLHPEVKDVDSFFDYLGLEDNRFHKENFVWDEKNPELVFISEHVYFNKRYHRKFKELFVNNRAFIFHGGEYVYPDFNLYDFAIGYPRLFSCDDRYIRFPVVVMMKHVLDDKSKPLTLDEAKAAINSRKFCNFIYSNPKAHPIRDNLFFEISKYKKVDSYGKHLNNMGNECTRNNKNWGKMSIELKNQYKFTIACENAIGDGYTTEKLLTTFNANSIPIYWGNPKVADEYNPESFINCHDYDSIDKIIDRIKEIDENDDLWYQMVSQPWQTEKQKKATELEIIKYYEFLEHIFTSNIKELIKRPLGTYGDKYSEHYFSQNNFPNIITRGIDFIKRKFVSFKNRKGRV